MRRAVGAISLVLALVVAACAGGDDDDAAATYPTDPPPPTTTLARLTFKSPDEAAAHVRAAWQENNRDKALQGGEVAAVDVLFSRPASQLQFRGCDAPTSLGADCTYRYTGGLLVIHVSGSAAIGWRVATAKFMDG